ncbi:MAG: hypothetical protein ACRYF0_19640 [Janthinobacterium lividum]
MYVERVLSINNGWSILTTQKREEWEESKKALRVLDNTFLDKQLSSIEEENNKKANFIYYLMYSYINYRLIDNSEWSGSLPDVVMDIKKNFPIEAKNRAVKNGVYASLVGINELTGGDFTHSFYVNIPHYYNNGGIDVSILFIPTSNAIEALLGTGIHIRQIEYLPSEEVCRVQLSKLGLPSSPAPIVLAFFSPTEPEEITVEELSTPKISEASIERTLEFAPEYYQASVGLLSFFGKILRDKDPQTKAKVRIEQDGNIVRLHIESAPGNIETIEERLEQYALIVNKQAPPESLLDNPGQIVELKAQLRVAQMQVETAYELKQLSDGRITSLEKQVEFLQSQFAAQILQTDKVIDIVGRQNDSHERMQAALLTHSGTLFKDLLQESSGNQRLAEAVTSLRHNLLSGMATIDIEDKLEQALATIKETKPGFLGRILKELEGAAYKASASSTLTWVTAWLGIHTKN